MSGRYSRYNSGSGAFEFRLLWRVTSRTQFPDVVEQQPLEPVQISPQVDYQSVILRHLRGSRGRLSLHVLSELVQRKE